MWISTNKPCMIVDISPDIIYLLCGYALSPNKPCMISPNKPSMISPNKPSMISPIKPCISAKRRIHINHIPIFPHKIHTSPQKSRISLQKSPVHPIRPRALLRAPPKKKCPTNITNSITQTSSNLPSASHELYDLKATNFVMWHAQLEMQGRYTADVPGCVSFELHELCRLNITNFLSRTRDRQNQKSGVDTQQDFCESVCV